MHDQYLSFIALEGRLFSLGLPSSYLQLNDPKAQDTQIQVCKHWTLVALATVLEAPKGCIEGCQPALGLTWLCALAAAIPPSWTPS